MYHLLYTIVILVIITVYCYEHKIRIFIFYYDVYACILMNIAKPYPTGKSVDNFTWNTHIWQGN